MRFAVRITTRFAIAFALLAMPTAAGAQAWVAPQGEGSVTFAWQRILNEGHRLTDGQLIKGGQSENMGLFLQGDYAFTDRLSVSAGIPFVFGKYTDSEPGPFGFLPVDECHCWNSGWQDVSLIARYNLVNGTLGLTPSLSFNAPSHNYDFQGEAAIGRHLREMRVALDAGKRLDVISPRLFVQGGYSFAFVERTGDVGNNRSGVSIEGAYQLGGKTLLRGLSEWQHTHGGLRFGSPGSAFPPPGDINTPERVAEHDRLLRDNYWHAGGGLTYSFEKLDVFGTYIHYLSGTDTHAGRSVTVGVSVPFRLGER